MRINKALRRIVSAGAAAAVALSMTVSAFAREPYRAYIYDTWDDSVPSQNAYRVDKTITGHDMGLERLSDPSDPLFVDELAPAAIAGAKDFYLDTANEEFWLADSDNDRVLRLDIDLNVTGCYTGVFGSEKNVIGDDGESKFDNPTGLFVRNSIYGENELYIYIADYDNARIVKAMPDPSDPYRKLTLVHEYTKPETDLYQVQTFNPSKVVVDFAENVYAVVSSVNQGAVQFNREGAFQGFYGANRVEVTAAVIAQKLWRKIASNEQISGMKRSVPVEYANFDMDDDGFIYTVTEAANASTDAVKKLNPAGYNIWDNNAGNEYHFGDVAGEYDAVSNTSHNTRLTDICVSDYGIMNVLDFETGRVFQYDRDANLLCIFGTKRQSSNDQRGSFSNPNAVEAYAHNIYVLDGAKCDITVYSETTFGQLMHQAVELYDQGRYSEAKPIWESVLARDGGYPLAYIGLGKAALNEGEYSKALDYFKTAYDQKDYDKAFKYAREEYIRNNFTGIVIVILVVVVFLVVLAQLHKRNIYLIKGRIKFKKRKGGLEDV
ncbi:MAG: tetratricopeptide repeat protein [Ruminococcus sp.]|nr:tetratricopeptide repeat protein [Ruminococcus sp.]